MENETNPVFKSGTAIVVGRPSSGKSTLVNSMCGTKISIVSKLPQTTRFLIKGIYTDNEAQIIFVDTPGFHNFNLDLNRALSNSAINALDEGDFILFVIDPSRDFGEEEEELIQKIKRHQNKTILVFNKSDLDSERFQSNIENIKVRLTPLNTFIVSALKDVNIDNLIRYIKTVLPVGPQWYPEDFVTDQDIGFRIKECVREKIFLTTGEEIPHSCYVDIDKLTVNNKSIKVYASVCVEKESQKGMIIGKSAKMIKQIGEEARKELIEIFEKPVNLFLNVKVHHNWRKNITFIKRFFELR